MSFQGLPEALLPGRVTPLGSQPRDGGVNLAVFSEHATAVEVCVFDGDGQRCGGFAAGGGPGDGQAGGQAQGVHAEG